MTLARVCVWVFACRVIHNLAEGAVRLSPDTSLS